MRVDLGNYAGQLIDIVDDPARLLIHVVALREQAVRGVLEVLRHHAGLIEHSLPRNRIVGVHAELRKTLKQIADVWCDSRRARHTKVVFQGRKIRSLLLIIADSGLLIAYRLLGKTIA